ncbi:MAG: zf-HC2 domain-containing protein [Woeseia sp.]
MSKQMKTGDHELVDELLPWFVNNTLSAAERDQVRQHLDGCTACQESVSLLSAVQSAVRHEPATPIVPPPRVEKLMAAIDGKGRKKWRLQPLAVLGIAASVAGALVIVTLLMPEPEQPLTGPARYETTTSPLQAASMDYVLDLHFTDDSTAAARERVLRNLDARDVNKGVGASYRVTVNVPAASLEELERYTGALESMSEIESVGVVAVQLPMKKTQ